MQIFLTPELENLVGEKVKDGLYNSASEVVCHSLQLLFEQDALKVRRLEELRREVRDGLAQLEAGDAVAYPSPRAVADDVKARGRATLASQAAPTSQAAKTVTPCL